jgi:hypothetical protein
VTQPAVAATKLASLWTRILAVLYVFDDALSTKELEYVERRLEKLERELSTLKAGRC